MKKHTDLDGVKQVASALLFTDIEKTKYSPMVVQHPFTNTGVTAISVEGSFQFLNLLENPKDLDMWRQSMRQQIHNAETPYQIYSLINSPYPAWSGSTTSKVSNSDIKSSLGLGIVRFEEQPEEPVITTYDYEYQTNTEVITAVEVSGGQSDPDNPVTVRFHINGTTYTVSNIYYRGHLERCVRPD